MIQRKISLGITGGIGSGKSYVCHLLEKKGIPIFYTDDEAKKEMLENKKIHRALRCLISPDAVKEDGSPNREIISNFICKGKEYALKINAIVHPLLRDRMMRWQEAQTNSVIAVECALLFESGFNDVVDKSILILAPLELKIKRVMERDGVSRDKVLQMMSLQMSDENKRSLADYILINDEIISLQSQLDQILNFF